MPDPRSFLRLLALIAFLLTVALALWLLEAEWPVVVLVMGIAWTFAAGFEWAAWRYDRERGVVSPAKGAALLDAPVPPPLAVPTAEAAPQPSLLVPPAESNDSSLAMEGERVAREPPAAEARRRETAEEPAASAPTPTPAHPPLRPVPPPAAPPGTPPPPAAGRPAPPAGVVDLRRRATVQPRHWNLWDLERLARDELHGDPLRFEALSYLFVHLRQFASPDGSLPTEFDGLVRESFGDLLEQRG